MMDIKIDVGAKFKPTFAYLLSCIMGTHGFSMKEDSLQQEDLKPKLEKAINTDKMTIETFSDGTRKVTYPDEQIVYSPR